MENNNIDLLGMEKVDRSEKSILDENNELKKQLISLQRNLEEKDKRISILEMQLQKQIKNFSNNHVFTQVRNDICIQDVPKMGHCLQTFIYHV